MQEHVNWMCLWHWGNCIICEQHSKALKRYSILVWNNCKPFNIMFKALIYHFPFPLKAHLSPSLWKNHRVIIFDLYVRRDGTLESYVSIWNNTVPIYSACIFWSWMGTPPGGLEVSRPPLSKRQGLVCLLGLLLPDRHIPAYSAFSLRVASLDCVLYICSRCLAL